jgi:hypothetical protein
VFGIGTDPNFLAAARAGVPERVSPAFGIR